MDPIRPHKQNWMQSGPPKLRREADSAPQDTVSPYAGSADYFRELARQKLEVTMPNPSANLVEFAALQMVEHKYLEQGSGEVAPAPASGQPKLGMLGNPAYMASLTSAQLACFPALAPVFVSVLGDLDPGKILGPSNSNGDNKWIIAGGSLADQIKVSQALGAQGQVLGFPLTGVLDPGEQSRVAQALQPMMEQIGAERLQRILKNVHLQTMLGEMQNSNSPGGMAGLGGAGQVAISRDALLNPDTAKEYLGHEIGHLVDEEMGPKFGVFRLSDHPTSPFGKGAKADFRSDYGRRNAMEDFAEAHSDLMQNWRLYKQFPELGMQSRGKYGEKLTFIAQNCYDWKLQPPRPHLQKMSEEVHSGQSPLGYRNGAGELVDADKHLQRILKTLQQHTGPGGKLDEAALFNVSNAEQTRRRWVLNALRQHSNEPVQAISVQAVVADLAEGARRGRSVLQALEMGGPYFYDQCRQALGDGNPLQSQLSAMMIVAGPTWQAGTF